MTGAQAEARPLYVGGEWVTTERTRPTRNPATGETTGSVCLAGDAEVEASAVAACQASRALRSLSSGERAALLRDLAARIEDARDRLAGLITEECAKPIALAQGEVERALSTLQIAAEEATRVGGEVLPLDRSEKGRGRTGIVRRFPIGPVVGITPYNFPLNLALHKLAPALGVGCPIVLKAADQTPRTLLALAEVFGGVAFPRGSLSVLNAEIPQAETLVRDPRFKLLSFTGSPAVGYLLKERCGHKKVLLELGGNAAVYVDRSADVARAAERIAFGALAYSGQVCISVQRIYAHREVYERLREELVTRFQAARGGSPLEDGVTVVNLIDEAAAERVERLVEDARGRGGAVLCGGERQGAYYPATLLEGVPEDAPANREEAFGPLATIAPVDGADDAFRRINDSRFGLQAGVFTNDLQQLLRAHEELEVGGVMHDDVPTWRVDEMPYGGVKDSGLGREGLRQAMRAMSEPRLLVLRRS